MLGVLGCVFWHLDGKARWAPRIQSKPAAVTILAHAVDLVGRWQVNSNPRMDSPSLAYAKVIQRVVARVQQQIGERSMDPELIDRIYECSFVPELWPGVLRDLGEIIDAPRGALYVLNRTGTHWTVSPGARVHAQRAVNEGWLGSGQFAARLFGARHAGFLVEYDVFTPDELEVEPIYRDFMRPVGLGWGAGTRCFPCRPAKNLSGFESSLRTRTGGTRVRAKAR